MGMIGHLVLNLPSEVDRRLERLARAAGLSKYDYVVDALSEHVADQDDVLLAEERLANLRAGRSTSISLEELMKRHGMAD